MGNGNSKFVVLFCARNVVFVWYHFFVGKNYFVHMINKFFWMNNLKIIRLHKNNKLHSNNDWLGMDIF